MVELEEGKDQLVPDSEPGHSDRSEHGQDDLM